MRMEWQFVLTHYRWNSPDEGGMVPRKFGKKYCASLSQSVCQLFLSFPSSSWSSSSSSYLFSNCFFISIIVPMTILFNYFHANFFFRFAAFFASFLILVIFIWFTSIRVKTIFTVKFPRSPKRYIFRLASMSNGGEERAVVLSCILNSHSVLKLRWKLRTIWGVPTCGTFLKELVSCNFFFFFFFCIFPFHCQCL